MSKAFGLLVANPCGIATWKKSKGIAPLGSRLLVSKAFTWASVAFRPEANEFQVLISDWASKASFGTLPKPGGVLPVLNQRKLGWLKALMKSTLNCSLRRPSAPHGKAIFFCSEKSKNSCIGARRLTVRGAFPREPLAGRMNADGFR